MKKLGLFLIKVYQLTMRPFVGQACRFYPSCSDYTYEAIEKHGICKGTYLGVKRICKCNPFHPGGPDLVP